MTTILLISSLIITIYVIIKYIILNNTVKSIIKELDKPLRKGYYEINCTQNYNIKYEPIVYVSEIDRYTNGKSKIKLDHIEINCGDSNFKMFSAKTFVEKEFKSLVDTADITWLESEQTIKDIRRQKLKKLEEKMKK